MNKSIRISLYTLLALVLLGATPVWANELSVTPLLIDKNLDARDVSTQEVTLKNDAAYKMVLYATVNEVAVDTTGVVKEFVSPVMTDRTDTITSWIEISRGRIELEPGETKTVPLTLRIHPFVKPGEYHAFVGFVPGPNRPAAESIAMAGDAKGIIVKVTVEEDSNDLLSISSFLVNRFVIDEDKRAINIEVTNSGDAESIPKGEIIFYNSRGEEKAAVKINEEGAAVPAGEKKTFIAEIPFYNEFGRFKANARINYGANQQAAVFDTTQFFMIPLPILIALCVTILVFSLFVTYLIRRAFYDEIHEDDDGNDVPLYIRSDREHETKDHDIHLSKNQ